ncbi:NmrA family NAD(P)-binding protein [Actinoplanes auranticolor]|uniref:NmrA family NAD(P)-binding protein n=1 Tax=Actinoplanes auranticolor TaxID=47988 RepID=UPI001BB333B9
MQCPTTSDHGARRDRCQGGGVARGLLADGTFDVRAVTRNATSPKALTLVELGAEVVEADLTDEAACARPSTGRTAPSWSLRSGSTAHRPGS